MHHGGRLKYLVDLPKESHEIAFYKSPKSDRWWMDVPVPNQDKSNLLPSCSYRVLMKSTWKLPKVPSRPMVADLPKIGVSMFEFSNTPTAQLAPSARALGKSLY